MGLRLKIKPGEVLVINGCIVKNGDRSLSIEIMNRADVLRGNEIINEEDANTPIKRLCHQIQIALVHRELREEVIPIILSQIAELGSILNRDHAETFEAVACLVRGEEFYSAYRKLSSDALLNREMALLSLPIDKN